jgi:hypothetical protein
MPIRSGQVRARAAQARGGGGADQAQTSGWLCAAVAAGRQAGRQAVCGCGARARGALETAALVDAGCLALAERARCHGKLDPRALPELLVRWAATPGGSPGAGVAVPLATPLLLLVVVVVLLLLVVVVLVVLVVVAPGGGKQLRVDRSKALEVQLQSCRRVGDGALLVARTPVGGGAQLPIAGHPGRQPHGGVEVSCCLDLPARALQPQSASAV